MKIKNHCWRIDGQQSSYFLKKYRHEETFRKVSSVQRQLQPAIQSIAPAIAFQEPFIVYKWLHSRPANYNNADDCRSVWEMLSALHVHGQDLVEQLPALKLQAKWHYRLLQFELLQPILQPILQRYFQDVVRVAQFALERATFPKEEVTLLHGDVAHHNFLFTTTASYMIDFDLAAAGCEAEEAVLFMHRLLPHFDYNLYALLQAVPELEMYSRYFQLLLFPNELMREWLFFYEEPLMQRYLCAMTETAIERWPMLYEQIERLL